MVVPHTHADRPTRAQLLVTCLVDHFHPATADAVVVLLERAGLTVEVPDGQTCCGQPAFNAGGRPDATAMARHTVGVLSRSPAPVVVPSGSCADMLIHHAPALLKDDPVWGPRAAEVAARTYELTIFLVDVLGVPVPDLAGDAKLTYHACCHGLRGLGVDRQPAHLLSRAGDRLVPLPEAETCCGFGGLFAVKMADISGAMLERKCGQIVSTGADTVVVTDVSCAMHMQGGLQRQGQATRVRHIAEILAEPPEAP